MTKLTLYDSTTMSNFMYEQKIDLEKRLENICLEKNKIDEIKTSNARKIVTDKVLGAFKITSIISTIMEWNDGVKKEIKDAKISALLSQYLNIVDDNTDSITKLKDFLSNPHGNTLYNKIVSILDDSPPDIELINHLSVVLTNMTNSEFESMFDEHKYALALLSQLTPQALTILADNKNWVMFTYSGLITNNIVVSDWLKAFSEPYIKSKNISMNIAPRIENSINELIQKKYIEARKQDNNQFCQVHPTRIGDIILKYVTYHKN